MPEGLRPGLRLYRNSDQEFDRLLSRPSAERKIPITLSLRPTPDGFSLSSGDVTFSDGKTGKWYLDQMGRLGIGNLPEGYRPAPTDAALFQQQLMSLLQAKGLC